jgi:hypothetical protein
LITCSVCCVIHLQGTQYAIVTGDWSNKTYGENGGNKIKGMKLLTIGVTIGWTNKRAEGAILQNGGEGDGRCERDKGKEERLYCSSSFVLSCNGIEKPVLQYEMLDSMVPGA